MKKYAKYKSSGVEWLGEIPENWDCFNLKFILRENIKDGPHETPIWFETGIPFLSIDGIIDGEISFENCRYIDEEQYEKFSKKLIIEKDDIFVGKAASIGKIARVKTERKFTVWSPIAVIKVDKNVSPVFVEYFLKSDIVQYQIEIFSTSNTQKNIAMGDIPKMKVICPPQKEQEQIAVYLDYKTKKIDTVIAKKQKLIELLKEERTAIINQSITKGINPKVRLKPSGVEWIGDIPENWILSKIGYVSKVVRGASPRPAGDPLLFNGNFMPWITVKEVTNANGKFINSTETYLTELGAKQTRILEPETLILSNSGATLGVPRITLIRGAINDGSVAFLNLNIEREFLYYFFETHTKIYRDEANGYGQPNLNTEIVKSTPIPVPPLDEQKAIIIFIESEQKRIDIIITKTEQEIELLKEYKSALINEVVTGKIDVRDEVIK